MYKSLLEKRNSRCTLLPYNFNFHWILLRIDMGRSQILVYDSQRRYKDRYLFVRPGASQQEKVYPEGGLNDTYTCTSGATCRFHIMRHCFKSDSVKGRTPPGKTSKRNTCTTSHP
ncbi:hypothetical protein ACP4OV_026859 [Aristida adscensionis]